MLNKAVPHQAHHLDLIQTRTQTQIQVHLNQRKVPRKTKRARAVQTCKRRKVVKGVRNRTEREEGILLQKNQIEAKR